MSWRSGDATRHQVASLDLSPSPPPKDGTGFNVEVHSFPLDGRIVLFPAELDARASDDDADAEAEAPPVRPAATTGRNGQHQRRR